MQWLYSALITIIRNIFKTFYSPMIEEQKQGLQRIEKKQEEVIQALNGFASAMAEYAKHLQNHTQAIQDLAKASGELKEAAKEQNKFLKGLAEFLEGLKEKRGG